MHRITYIETETKPRIDARKEVANGIDLTLRLLFRDDRDPISVGSYYLDGEAMETLMQQLVSDLNSMQQAKGSPIELRVLWVEREDFNG